GVELPIYLPSKNSKDGIFTVVKADREGPCPGKDLSLIHICIIPYLGFAVGIIAAVIASLFQFGMDWTHLLLVGVVFM
ncbi:hypothetical protein AB723_19375, partial [Acinetobacter baumannii]|uniref:hypothetical protein n=1 Tax=Acinetobacter baumannii TaxID=470 RepID=UPI000E2B80A6